MADHQKIADGIYWVGERESSLSIECNPYLIIENGEGVLLDPGSVLDFSIVLKQVTSLISLDKISLVIAHHQDPDLCGSIPLFYRAGLTAPLALHWRTGTIVKYYGIENGLYIVNEKAWEWSFASGRKLKFIPAPYCHFAGAVMTYDAASKTLFSGDLFGSFTTAEGLYAKSGYHESMKAFHEHYMPSHDILRPVMDSLLTMEISRIAPQHGRIIAEDIPQYILELRNLKCGTYSGNTAALQYTRTESGLTPVNHILNCVLERLSHLYPPQEVRQTFTDSVFVLKEDSLRILSVDIGGKVEGILNAFIEKLVAANGIRWFTVIEPFLFSLIDDFRIPLPPYMMKYLPAAAPMPERTVQQEETVRFDRKTGLSNGNAFKRQLGELLNANGETGFGILVFSVDNLEEINQMFGRKAGDDALKSLIYILKNSIDDPADWNFFKLDSPYIACIARNREPEAIRKMAEKSRYEAGQAEYSAEKILVSAGIFYTEQLLGLPEEKNEEYIERMLLARLFRASKSPSGGICDYLPDEDTELYLRKRILLVDPDNSYIRFLEPYFEERGYHLLTASDGSEIQGARNGEGPDLIIAEAMAPRVNGFELREKMLSTASGRNIPFILISRRKDEEFIRRAALSGILYYLKKPFSTTELFGLIDNLLRQEK
jgi:two-component system cell cycle response regulator